MLKKITASLSTTYLLCLFGAAVLSVASMTGCPADDGNVADASVTMDDDAGTDAGSDIADAGTNSPDAGMSTMDAGTNDAGMGVVDAGSMYPDLFPEGLECPTISFCSSYDADPTRVPFPEDDQVGGEVQDGLYMAVQGSSIPFGLAISGDKFSTIFRNLVVSHGTFETVDGIFRKFRDTACAFEVLNNDSIVYIETEQFYYAAGDELITYSGCGSAIPTECNSPTRMIRVESMCDNLDQLICPPGETCHCAEFRDVIPERPENGDCVFEEE